MIRKLLLFYFLILMAASSLVLDAENVRYGTGDWDSAKFGNHRVVLHVSQNTDIVYARIPWRRRDFDPHKKDLILIDAFTGKRVLNIFRIKINREYGNLLFQPETAPGEYFLYYLPNEMTGRSNYPTVIYPEPKKNASPDWLNRNGLDDNKIPDIQKFYKAEIKEIQSIDKLNSFFPMEVIATAGETRDLLLRNSENSYLIFPEDRKYPIRMPNDLPQRWIKSGAGNPFHGQVLKGEYFAFQIGIFASQETIEDIEVRFEPLKQVHREAEAAIPESAFSCFNTEGIDWTGRSFDKKCRIEKGKIQALWCGVQIPIDTPPGEYRGKASISPLGLEKQEIELIFDVKKDSLKDAGDSEPWRLSRLRWLNSLLAFDDGIVPPFTPVKVKDLTVSCLGREVDLTTTGFPKSIRSFFAPEMTHLNEKSREVLASPIKLVVETKNSGILSWTGGELEFVKMAEGLAVWNSKSKSGSLIMDCRAGIEFDGCIEYEISLRAEDIVEIRDIRLNIPIRKDIAKYMMGMGYKGGKCPQEFQWKWDQKNNQDSVWIGDVNAGLQCSFKDENYTRPLNTNFYLLKPLNMPPSWYNQGKGGCRIKETDGGTYLISVYSGDRRIQAGEVLHFNFRLLLTPFKTLDTKGQWSSRYYHRYVSLNEILSNGANTVNVHHATEINPYINYPFLRPKKMKAYINEAHAAGLKVKIYYTVRELSNRAPEIFALRSLGDEVLSYGPGGGFSWLQEHLGSNYIAAWFVPPLKDAAVINSGVSRWHNYYVEGLNWLVKNVGIDGLYIDDVAFDRTTMKRVRKILDRGREGALIDLHSANQFNVRDGFANSANLYLEHFPYINRLWFGEYFDYGSSPDFWLIEVSGIPFGIMGEMLQDGGNPWRGMIFGMTSRLPWAGNPKPLWQAWDDFGIQDSRMIGYWAPSVPVKTGNKDILATVYAGKSKVMIALASWAQENTDIHLTFDWNALGLDPGTSRLYAPPIKDFQKQREFKPGEKIPVESGKGWLLILSEDLPGK